MIYALLDSSEVIEVNHLESALAVWRYCQESAEFIFAGREVNPYAQKILELLQDQGEMTTKDIYDAFSRNISKRQMEEAQLIRVIDGEWHHYLEDEPVAVCTRFCFLRCAGH